MTKSEKLQSPSRLEHFLETRQTELGKSGNEGWAARRKEKAAPS